MELRLNKPQASIYGRTVTTESVKDLFFQQIKELTLRSSQAHTIS